MIEAISLLLAGLAGTALGAIFFGLLWWSTRQALASGHSALWFAGSLLVRLALGTAGFYWVGQDRWERWLACLAGFVLVRVLSTLLSCSQPYAAVPTPARQVRDAP